MPKKPLVQEKSDVRSFTYSLGDVQLNFSLRIDHKNQLRNFKELLEKALDDVKTEIERRTE